MKKLYFFCTALIALGAASCSSGNSSKTSDSDSIATAKEAVVASEEAKQNYEITDGGLLSTNGLPMIVDFSAVWCPPCQELKPIFAELKKEYTGKVDFVTIDVDSMPDLANHYKIESIPALIFIAPDGAEVNRVIGFQEKASLKGEITKNFNL
nr:hypothetical protein Muribac2_280 [uncultured Muribaculaceae bacterium]